MLEATNAGGASQGTAAHKRRFNDKFEDDIGGLTYYGARFYDKTLIGWTQADPLFRFAPDAAWGSPRRAACYMFSGQNPLRYVDPDGLSFITFVTEVAHKADSSIPVMTQGPVADALDRGANMLAAASNPISALVDGALSGPTLMDVVNEAINPSPPNDALAIVEHVINGGPAPPPSGQDLLEPLEASPRGGGDRGKQRKNPNPEKKHDSYRQRRDGGWEKKKYDQEEWHPDKGGPPPGHPQHPDANGASSASPTASSDKPRDCNAECRDQQQ